MKNLSAYTNQIRPIKFDTVQGHESPLMLAAINLRNHRRMKQLTVRQAAELCSMAVGTYTALEKGNPGSGAENLMKALGVMGVKLDKAFVTLDLPEGGVVTRVINGKARRTFPDTNSLKRKVMGFKS